MKAVLHLQYGPPEVLQLGEAPTPEPGEGEIRIRIAAATVTSGDARVRRADPPLVRLFFGFLKPSKRIPGFEFAGTIEKIGAGVLKWKEGDRVFGVSGQHYGTLAEYLILKADSTVARIPESWSFAEAAAIPFGAGTAKYFLQNKGRLLAGERVCIHGASGSVGVAAVQIAKLLGADVDGVCGPDNLELVSSLGADHVFNYHKETPPQGTYDLTFDAAGKLTKKEAAPWLKPSGRYVSVNRGYAKDRAEDYPDLTTWMNSGQLQAVIGHTFSIDDIVEAHRLVDTGHKRGVVSIIVQKDP